MLGVGIGNRATKKRRPRLGLLCGDFSVPLEKSSAGRELYINAVHHAKNRTHTS